MDAAPPLVWIDLEMSGLDPDHCQILEIAAIITDGDLNIVAEGPDLVIHQPDAVLDAMDEWCTRQHGNSGLTAAVKASTVALAEAEAQVLELVRSHCPPGKSPLCGNSIGHDRRFLIRYMPALVGHLSYRNIDVSSVKELVRRWYPTVSAPAKRETHRALDDIRESIAELRFYREHVFR
ncbi:oligoribonuclease [Nannocystis sp. ILAH1]|uniref:oligoribonuclease n=1 Tax=unclassified Nannocystis TaxID=2627009 RepID=UPI0022708B70|nr:MULTISPECIES: oligoribonuclease [unclassified Nannocystis]MCY0988857.1 oligoribonuclease [Nannocystis sp. ILAH1]MCY1072717.1 oligoribonuclease [Nannocystis sp. RBIL2]